jgi:hypothetical protein
MCDDDEEPVRWPLFVRRSVVEQLERDHEEELGRCIRDQAAAHGRKMALAHRVVAHAMELLVLHGRRGLAMRLDGPAVSRAEFLALTGNLAAALEDVGVVRAFDLDGGSLGRGSGRSYINVHFEESPLGPALDISITLDSQRFVE